MFHIVVCAKAVPDPKQACKVKIDPVSKTLMRCEVPMVLNALDKNALEAALQIKKQHNGKITLLSMGPPDAAEVVKECLALGADEGVLLSDPAFGGADAYATAYTLARAVEKLNPVDLVLCGMASSDGATEWVGPEMAVFLDMPVVTMVREIVEFKERRWVVKADLTHGYRLMEVALPAVLTVTRDLNTPRTLSFSGIVKARKKSVTIWNIADLGLPADKVGLAGSPTIVSALVPTDNRRTVTFLAGTLEEKASQLVDRLVDAGLI
jgi:electron transfer flavoprotein alpha/beta subunit